MERHPQWDMDVARAAQKQAARDADVRAVQEGRKSVGQVNRDNSLAHGLVHKFKMRAHLGVRRGAERDPSR